MGFAKLGFGLSHFGSWESKTSCWMWRWIESFSQSVKCDNGDLQIQRSPGRAGGHDSILLFFLLVENSADIELGPPSLGIQSHFCKSEAPSTSPSFYVPWHSTGSRGMGRGWWRISGAHLEQPEAPSPSGGHEQGDRWDHSPTDRPSLMSFCLAIRVPENMSCQVHSWGPSSAPWARKDTLTYTGMLRLVSVLAPATLSGTILKQHHLPVAKGNSAESI